MALNLDQLLIQVILTIIFVAPALWLSGRLLAGKEKAKFTDAIWIAVLGNLIGGAITYFFSGIIASIIVLIIWLALVKHFFDCGWLKALAIAIVAILIFIAVAFLLALLFGIALAGFIGFSGIF
jgi:hypothetical protein